MRTAEQRRGDAVRRLDTEANVWLATASATGTPHLVPLSLGWDGSRLLVATPSETPTARNAIQTGVVKASLDGADDVVLIDATVEVIDFSSADSELLDAYVQRVGWNPAAEDGDWSLLLITPVTIRSWNGIGETTGRTIMKRGCWVAESA